MTNRPSAAVTVCLVFIACIASASTVLALGKPPNPAELAEATSFGTDDRVIATHYFYWYHWPSEHFFDDPARQDSGLRHHFIDPTSVSYKSKDWHKEQAQDMLAAGIDALLCIYWGAPARYHDPRVSFSVEGLPPLVAALDELAAQGKAPKVGMFYDTSTLAGDLAFDPPRPGNVDLRTEEGRDIFYRTIRDFFYQIPPRHWLCLDGRPVVQLYGAGFSEGHDQGTVDYVYAQFQKDFHGRRPYIITGPSWFLKADAATGWGASIGGPILGGDVAQIGPGYDDSPVPGRTTLTRDRLGGGYYVGSWLLALQSKPRLVIIETWNELHEGTGICPSLEDGRDYVKLTRRFADKFHAGVMPKSEEWAAALERFIASQPSRPAGREFASRLWLECSVDEAGQVVPGGIRLDTGQSDGRFGLMQQAGRWCIRGVRGISPYRFLYFDVADPYYYDHSGEVVIEITYYDEGTTPIYIEYDAIGTPRSIATRYKRHEPLLTRTDSKQWKTERVTLSGARFANGQNGGCDFRVVSEHTDLILAKIRLTKLTPPYLQQVPDGP